jgi:hypothetical protein
MLGQMSRDAGKGRSRSGRRLRRGSRLAIAVAPAFLLVACGIAPAVQTSPAHPSIRQWSATILLHGKPLELHLAAPQTPVAPDLVVLYASGDGGWFGAAVDMFRHIAGDGYSAVGFSSRAFLKIERPHGVLVSAADLSDEYEQILKAARVSLGLGEQARVVLTGWSRGAAFAVLVGSEPPVREGLSGVIGIGLAADENLGLDDKPEETDEGEYKGNHRRGQFDTYRRIAELGAIPCAVIQSTHDGYLPASRAQALFGPNTSLRRFYAVEASNHRFSGGKPAFDAALSEALRWIANRRINAR